MHPLTTQIQTQYPTPRKAHGQDHYEPGAYCIGGAVCFTFPHLIAGLRAQPFPSPRDLAEWLFSLNPALPEDAAYDFASRITHNNDAGAYERGWALLDQALSYIRRED